MRSHPVFSDPFSENITEAGPRPTDFVAILSATARKGSVNVILAENATGFRGHVQRMADGWEEDATGVVIFFN